MDLPHQINALMPELPEVETIVSDLNRLISGKVIKKVWFDTPKQISIIEAKKGAIRRFNLGRFKNKSSEFTRAIADKKIIKVGRRAKNILVFLSGDKVLLLHPKMTGHLLLGNWQIGRALPLPQGAGAIQEKVNNHIHFILEFRDKSMLGFSDARKFGKILFGERQAILKSDDLKLLGPEPLHKDFTLGEFRKIVAGTALRSKVEAKRFLLDQSKIAGIGNIYSDEILWLAKINPTRRVRSLKEAEIRQIYKAIIKILRKAVKYRGTSMSDYRDTSGKSGEYMKHILVYGRTGEKCFRCGGIIKRIVLGGRSAHFCPKCQP